MLLMQGLSTLLILSSHLVIGLPRLLFPLISPSITSFSIPRSSLTTCPKYLKADGANLDSSVHSGLIFSSTRTLVFLSIQDTLITHRQHHISNASTFFLSAFLIVQVSAPYSTIGNAKAFISFTCVASLIPLSFHIVVNRPSAGLPIAILLRISLSHNLSLVINAPRNMKLLTTSTIFLSTVTSPICPVVMTFVFRTHGYRSDLSLCFPHSLRHFYDVFIVQVSAPYSTIGNTKAFISFTCVASLIPLSFHIVVNRPSAGLPIAILLRISLSHNLSLVINAPRNMKLLTTSTIFLSTVTSPICPVVMTFVFRTHGYRSDLSLCFPHSLRHFYDVFLCSSVSSCVIRVSQIPFVPCVFLIIVHR